jgi:AcrR family transcriptional regulator
MGQPPDAGRAAVEFDATQQAILDAVATCIGRHGFRGATTRRIAREAGVNEVTLFRRFGSKAALLEAFFRREASFVEAEAVRYTGDLEADLAGIAAAYLGLAARRGGLFPLLLAELPRDPALRAAFAGPLRVLGEIMDILRRYQAAGQLRSEPLGQTYAALVGPIALAALAGALVPGGMAIPDPREHVRAFLQGRDDRSAR